MITFRTATEEDYTSLAELKWAHAVEDDRDYGERNVEGVDKEQFCRQFEDFCKRDSGYTAYVGCDGVTVVSAMFVYLIPKLPKPNGKAQCLAYLTNVYTAAQYRNKGIGSALLDYVKRQLVAQKCELVFAWRSDNSVRWYKRNGFAEADDFMQCVLCGE